MWQEKVEIEGPYNFDRAIHRLALDPLHIVNQRDRSVRIPIYGSDPEVATVQASGTTEQPVFIVSGAKAATKQAVLNTVTNIFQWNTSLKDIHDHFSSTSLKKLFQEHRGTPIVLDFVHYATLFKSIIHQQVNMKFAISLTETFVKTFGYTVDEVPFYPKPETIARLHTDQLRELKFSQRKAEYLIGIAQKLTSGELCLAKMSQLSDEEVINELTKIRGIGPWTAQSFLLFGLGRPNLFPMADIGIQRAISHLLELERKPTREEMLHYSKEWEPYLSYASLYLWRSVEVTE